MRHRPLILVDKAASTVALRISGQLARTDRMGCLAHGFMTVDGSDAIWKRRLQRLPSDPIGIYDASRFPNFR